MILYCTVKVLTMYCIQSSAKCRQDAECKHTWFQSQSRWHAAQAHQISDTVLIAFIIDIGPWL